MNHYSRIILIGVCTFLLVSCGRSASIMGGDKHKQNDQLPTPNGGPATSLASLSNTPASLSSIISPTTGVALGTSNGQSVLILGGTGITYTLLSNIRGQGSAIYFSNPGNTLDLNGFAIYYGGDNAVNDHGIHLWLSWWTGPSFAAGPAQWTVTSNGSTPVNNQPNNSVIKNGFIIDEGTGANSDGIFGYQNNGSTITNMQITANGIDSATINISYGDTTVTDSVLTDNASGSVDRYAGPANVFGGGNTFTATHNVLIGGNAGFNVGSNSQITKNVISQSNIVTNGYALFLWGANNILFADNIILPVGPHGGPGVLVNGSTGAPATNNTIQNNIILNSDAVNVEYPSGLNAAAIRCRYTAYSNTFTGNTSLGLAGDGSSNGGGEFTGASGLSLSTDGTGPNTFQNNNFSVILYGSPSDAEYYASAFTPAGEGDGAVSGSYDVVSQNTFKSNHLLIRIDNNLSANGNLQQPAIGNTFAWTDGTTAATSFLNVLNTKLSNIGLSGNAAAVSLVNKATTLIHAQVSGVPLSPHRHTWYTKYYTGNDYVTVLDSIWGAGVDPQNYTYNGVIWDGTSTARIGQTVQAKILGTGGIALANTVVVLTTDQGDTYNLTTDGNGKVDLPVIQFGIDKFNTAQGAPFSTNNRTTSTLSITGYSPSLQDNATLISQKANVVQIQLNP